MSKFVFSTLANDQMFHQWVGGGADIPVIGSRVLIKGGTGVANDRIITPLGVCTEITDEQAAWLEREPSFAAHVKGGFIVVQAKKSDAEKVAADMSLNDGGAPMTPFDYAADKQPVTAG